MMKRVLIPWEDIEALGGRVEGDPHSLADMLSHWSVATLPEEGALVLRVLWRHLGGRELGVMEVPYISRSGGKYVTVNGEKEKPYHWVIVSRGCVHDIERGTVDLGHGDITGPCEALAAIVHDEAENVRADKG